MNAYSLAREVLNCSGAMKYQAILALEGLAGRGYCVAVDFDGTLCRDKYPEIGEETKVVSLVNVLQHCGIKTILWTCRTDSRLEEAVAWCEKYDLHFDAVNENLPSTKARYGNDPRKVGADEYWDDKAINVAATPALENTLVFPKPDNSGGGNSQ